MRRWRQLVMILLAQMGLASLASHLTIWILGIQTTPMIRERFGVQNGSKPICAAGSSLTFYGLDWNRIAGATSRYIERCGLPAASPCELEAVYDQIKEAEVTVVGLSVYDLNEHFLSDFRSELVPVMVTVKDLRTSGAGWGFSKRILSQYPLTWLRVLFPTAGRSIGVMTGLRTKLRGLSSATGGDNESGPSFNPQSLASGRIEDWLPGRTLRNLAQFRAGCQGKSSFDGPKRLALKRLLGRAAQRGKVMVVVLPISPPFEREFVSEEVSRQLEELMAELQRLFPGVAWVRLDQVPELHSKRYYWDLVHLNVEGQSIATDALLSRLKGLIAQQ